MSEKNDFNKKTSKEIKWWAYAAWTLPFLALSSLGFLHFFGWETLYAKSIVVGAVVFFSVSVFWWWWALFKIKTLVDILDRVSQKFESVKDNIAFIKKDIQDKK